MRRKITHKKMKFFTYDRGETDRQTHRQRRTDGHENKQTASHTENTPTAILSSALFVSIALKRTRTYFSERSIGPQPQWWGGVDGGVGDGEVIEKEDGMARGKFLRYLPVLHETTTALQQTDRKQKR